MSSNQKNNLLRLNMPIEEATLVVQTSQQDPTILAKIMGLVRLWCIYQRLYVRSEDDLQQLLDQLAQMSDEGLLRAHISLVSEMG